MLFGTPGWAEIRKLDFAGRLEAIQSADTRQRLIEEAKADANLTERTRAFFWLATATGRTTHRGAEESLYSLAKAAGVHPVELWLDKMLATNGEALFHVRFFNNDLEALKSFLSADWMLPGIGDAGAHVSQIMDSGWTSFLLSHWVREQGLFSIQEAVRRDDQRQRPGAGLCGPRHAGPRHEGGPVNVIDLAAVAERQPKLVHDFPGGAPRLIQKAVG